MAVSALLLAMMVGFAAEPTTSTELDRIEGRAYAGVVHARTAEVQAPAHASPLPARAIAAVIAAVLALLWLASGVRVAIAAVRAPRSLLWWAVPARRGPPILV